MSQTGQSPKPAEHGSFLQPVSVEGRKVDFVQTAFSGTVSTLSLPYNTDATVSFSVILYDPTIPTAQRTSQNIIAPSNCLVFYYPDFFIDTDNNFAFEMGTGASLSSGQKKVYSFGQWDENTVGSGLSQRRIYQFFNNDSTPTTHTVYIHLTIKYIITG